MEATSKKGYRTMKKKPPATMTQLRDDLLEVYAAIRTGDIDLVVAKESTNAAGKIIKSASVQLKYAEACSVKPNIPFLE